MKKKQILNISDMCFSKNREDILVTSSLGSSVAMAIYDADARIGGIVIFMLPDSSDLEFDRSEDYRCIFGDTAIPFFLDTALSSGISLEKVKLIAAGGADMMELGSHGGLNIGHQNGIVVGNVLRNRGLSLFHSSMGGHENRSLSMDMENGFFSIDIKGRGVKKYEF